MYPQLLSKDLLLNQCPRRPRPSPRAESVCSLLPVELIDLVIWEVGGDATTLRNCTTVCHRWLSSARRHLSQHTSFTLHFGAAAPPAHELSALLSSSLCTILPYIANVTIDVGLNAVGLLQTRLKLLPASPPARKLRLRSASWDALRIPDRTFILSRFSAITVLQLQTVTVPREEFQALFGAFPALEELYLSSFLTHPSNHARDGPTPISSGPSDAFRSLRRWQLDYTEPLSVVGWVAAMSSPPPLKDLSMSLPLHHDPTHLRHLARWITLFAQTLEELTIEDFPSE
jgi:hypothetical protein